MEKLGRLNETASISKSSQSAQRFIQDLADLAGITINGQNPWDIQVHHKQLYQRVLQDGARGLGEAYMEKWWDCEQLDVLFDKILSARLDTKVRIPFHFIVKQLIARIVNLQSKSRAKVVARHHYDLGNDLFTAMLDKQMIYSCGYWKNANNLDEAQTNKLELICQKLELKPGLKLLDIGCGWGGLAKYAAMHHGVSVVGVTISKEQADFAKNYCQGLPIQIELKDYRDVTQNFDRVVSVGMFEHVGEKNYPIFMRTVSKILSDDGLFLLHTIGGNETTLMPNEWITTYIFPNGLIPSITQIGKASEKLFVMEDWHNFGAYYDSTLLAWHQNFKNNWHRISDHYDERFYRMWTYYLLSCAGSFRARTNQLWQIVLSKRGVKGVYVSRR